MNDKEATEASIPLKIGSLHTIASLIRGSACAGSGVSLAVAVHRRLTAAAYACRVSRDSYTSFSTCVDKYGWGSKRLIAIEYYS